jgi:hypothetical protein
MGVQASQGQPISLQARLQARVANYTLVSDNFIDALLEVAREYKIPMGIEWVRQASATHRVSLSGKDGTVLEIIRAILEFQPGYQMEERNGLVHVFAPRLLPDPQNFLYLKVGEFDVRDEAVEVAARQLQDLVRASVCPPKPVEGAKMEGGVGHSQGVEAGQPALTLKLHDVRVEDALDALSLASGRNVWVVTFADGQHLTPTGFRRTLSLWNDYPIPDDEQPVWDMFPWRHEPQVSHNAPTR